MADSHEEGGNGTATGAYTGPVATTSEPVHDPHDDPAFVTRTKFLSGVAILTGGVLSAAILVPVVGFAVVDSVKPETWRWVDAGPLSDFPKGQVTTVAISGPFPESDRAAFVNHREDGTVIAIWNRCAHLGCPTSFIGSGFNCPCHGGTYDQEGRVTFGPPPRPLDRFDVKIVTADGQDIARQESPSKGADASSAQPDARVLIGRPFSVDEDLNPYRLHGPGEEVTGVLANLYPF